MADANALPLDAEDAGPLAARLGIWVFLATEVLFFGGALVAFAVNRRLHTAEFAAAARETAVGFGTANTCVLLASSFTVALAVKAAEAKAVPLLRWLLATTVALAVLFLALKGFEYGDDLEKGLWPGAHFALRTDGARIFWSFYWTLTGLHGLHVLIGIGIFVWILSNTGRDMPTLRVEVPALYWHFVDLVWIFLYPLLYLGGRAT